ncbi:hypothetical protein BDV93DRAFT_584129 [Ceratobasidium sp. AG-I]|nr:hypothetical protein BDV93DRAFT_584129 [Ceratobasidium sp. AG-I]
MYTLSKIWVCSRCSGGLQKGAGGSRPPERLGALRSLGSTGAPGFGVLPSTPGHSRANRRAGATHPPSTALRSPRGKTQFADTFNVWVARKGEERSKPKNGVGERPVTSYSKECMHKQLRFMAQLYKNRAFNAQGICSAKCAGAPGAPECSRSRGGGSLVLPASRVLLSTRECSGGRCSGAPWCSEAL